MSKPWTDYLDEYNNDHEISDDDTIIELPQAEIIDLNESGTLQKEISYRFDENDPEKIIRTERIFQIITTSKKLSNAAITRKKDWIKFGQCKHIKKGVTERGVTTQRSGNFRFNWIGQASKKTDTKMTQQFQINERQIQQIQRPNINDNKTNDDTSQKSMSKNVYRPPIMAMEEEKVDIKIGNLPQWSEWNDVKQLIDTFYKNYLKQRYIPRYKIIMIPSNKRIEEWKANPIYYKRRLEEYERMAIVEFETKAKAEMAIEILNGHRYEYNVLQVEKARPRNISR